MATLLRADPAPAFVAPALHDQRQRRLAAWNRERLAPTLPAADWELTLARDYQMLRLEGEFMEALRDGGRRRGGAGAR